MQVCLWVQVLRMLIETIVRCDTDCRIVMTKNALMLALTFSHSIIIVESVLHPHFMNLIVSVVVIHVDQPLASIYK